MEAEKIPLEAHPMGFKFQVGWEPKVKVLDFSLLYYDADQVW